jgi:predicted nucleic acid-binding protein
LRERDDVAISELVLVELYGLLRNPKVVERPFTAEVAAATCQEFRRHPRWRILGFPADSVRLHDTLWERASQPQFARRRIYDLRTALCLLQQGVTQFATANIKDFSDLGFERVWNPLATG